MVLVIRPVVLLLCTAVVMNDRSPSPHPRTSRVRMQTPNVAGKTSAATSVSLPRGRTMTPSASRLRGASPAVSVGESRRSDLRDPNTFDACEQLDADHPDRVRAPSDPRGCNSSSPVYGL